MFIPLFTYNNSATLPSIVLIRAEVCFQAAAVGAGAWRRAELPGRVASRQQRGRGSQLRPPWSSSHPALLFVRWAAASTLRNVWNSASRVSVRLGHGPSSVWVDALIHSDVRGWPAASP